MDRNTVTGLLLMGLIMIGYIYLNQPSEEQIAATSANQAVISETPSSPRIKDIATPDHIAKQNDTLTDSLGSKRIALFNIPENHIDSILVLENDVLRLEINSKGASIYSAQAKDFLTWDKVPLYIIKPDSSDFGFHFPIDGNMVFTKDIPFEIKETYHADASNEKDSSYVVLRANGEENQFLEMKWSLKQNSYMPQLQISFSNLNRSIPNNITGIPFDWSLKSPRQEKNLENERNNTTIYYKPEDAEVDKISPTTIERLTVAERLKWVSFKQQFFSSAVIAQNGFNASAQLETVAETNQNTTKTLIIEAEIPYSALNFYATNLQFYIGPNHYETLKKSGYDLQDQIPLGWGIFGIVNRWIVIPAFNFLDGLNLGYGIVILLLTLYIKLILFPLQFRSYLSQAKMRVLKPEIDELNKQFENEDALKKQQAVMSLYKQAGVNPLGGCVPLLFQIPILFALFNFFPAAIELRQKSFLWADDLSTYDTILNLPFTIPFYGDHVSLFAMLMTVSTIMYTMMNNQISGTNAQMPQLKYMMYFMPVIFLFVLNSFPSGLNYYYFLANIITFGQQYAFMKLVDDKKIHSKIQENKKKPKVQKQSAFQKRLEEMARKQGYQQKKK